MLLGYDIVNLDLSECSLQGITCRVAPLQRDRSESEISHTFPVPAMCRRDSRVNRQPDEPADARPVSESARRSVCAHRMLKPAYKERLRENPGNEEQRAFLKLEVFFSLLRFVLCDRSLARSPGSPFFSLLLPHTVTKQELQKLLPGCGTIYV